MRQYGLLIIQYTYVILTSRQFKYQSEQLLSCLFITKEEFNVVLNISFIISSTELAY
jgi:hypothetical protein